jgi:hypothetical protein
MKILAILEAIENMSVDGLYHRDVGFPKDWKQRLPHGFNPFIIRLNYGNHARMAAWDDKYGKINYPYRISFKDDLQIFEIEIQRGTVVKMGVRMSYDKNHDLSIIFNPQDGFVRTVWLNEKNDTHRTLNTSNYRKPIP